MRLKPIAFALVPCRLHQLSYDDLYIGILTLKRMKHRMKMM